MSAPASNALPVRIRGLTKRYGAMTAVDGIDFEIGPGECVGVLGPNGAGKTTTVRMISCFTPITAGSAEVFGLDVSTRPREVKALIGICPQEDNLDPDFSVRKNLLVYGRYHEIPNDVVKRRADELLETMQLTEKAKADIASLSGGMKRRLVLARALLNEPRLLILDEPTTGLDPQARHVIWQRVRQLRAAGTTVLLTTHYMEEASQLCGRVILMNGGKILLEGAPADVIAREAGREVIEVWDLKPGLLEYIETVGWQHEKVEDRVYLYDREGGTIAGEITRGFPGQELMLRHATLEDVFLLRAGRTLKE